MEPPGTTLAEVQTRASDDAAGTSLGVVALITARVTTVRHAAPGLLAKDVSELARRAAQQGAAGGEEGASAAGEGAATPAARLSASDARRQHGHRTARPTEAAPTGDDGFDFDLSWL